jgi:hypothetical protein
MDAIGAVESRENRVAWQAASCPAQLGRTTVRLPLGGVASTDAERIRRPLVRPFWLVGLGGALLLLLCLFGHFSWLLWMIGFVGWRTRFREDIPPDEPITARTALVMPIYHEEVERVAAGIRATWLSARRAGLESHCDFFVLSGGLSIDRERFLPHAGRMHECTLISRLYILYDPPFKLQLARVT